MALQANTLQVASLASLHALSARPVHAQTKSSNASTIQKFQTVCSSRREDKQSLVQKVAQQAAVFGAIAVLGLSPSSPALADIQDDISNAASESFQTTKSVASDVKGNLQKLVPDVSGLNLKDKVVDQVDSVKAFGSDVKEKLPSSEEIPSAVPSVDIQSKYSEGLANGGDNTNEQKLNDLFDIVVGKSADAVKKEVEDVISKLPDQ